MVKIIPKKRLAARAQAQAQLPELVPKRAKVEQTGDRIFDLASVPRFEEQPRRQVNNALPVPALMTAPVRRRGARPAARSVLNKEPTPLQSLKKIYPKAMYKDVMKPQHNPRATSNSGNSNGGIPPVYVVSFARTGPGPWPERETGVVGTYHSAAAANLQVMAFFNEEAPWLTLGMVVDYRGTKVIKKRPHHEGDGVSYWLDGDNCLLLCGEDEDGRYTVYACRQEVRTDPFCGPYSEGPQRLAAEEWEVQGHVTDGFRRFV
ncbi:uncharacterized protein F4807DRAFT_445697 [Annulohypoxylon truncatum]|uniref:uncharacterized protein n=1 Tax=Annulohypoxylon truncatum TaxID=327061 RepID=UPI00200742FC|nr:uncharacterized protein F4807DRAFT_445697 [Annulohypoxylon truncatum]KAI1204792.1 hypothetical protein F4807DRAFT_445697 [Annulohypoxylon truncatum]